MQLDETYKGIIEKAQNDKNTAIKQCEKTYKSKIKSKQDTVEIFRLGGQCETLKAGDR